MQMNSWPGSPDKILTLHEPCKSAYTRVDLNGPRQVLAQLPGVALKEMEHHGSDTMCCGSGAICWSPDSCDPYCYKMMLSVNDSHDKAMKSWLQLVEGLFTQKKELL